MVSESTNVPDTKATPTVTAARVSRRRSLLTSRLRSETLSIVSLPNRPMISRTRSLVGSASSSTMAPSTRKTTRSAYAAAPGSWVTITTVWPRSSTTERRNRSSSVLAFESSAPVGSSAKTTSGREIRARADSHPLLLSTGELGGPVSAAGRRGRASRPRCSIHVGSGVSAGEVGGQRDVLLGRERRQQVERLEDEPEPVAAQERALPVRERGEVGVADEDLPRGQRVQAGQAMHQGRLARARGPHDRGELACR